MRTVAIICIECSIRVYYDDCYNMMTALLEYLDLLQIQATQNRIYGCSTKQGWSLR